MGAQERVGIYIKKIDIALDRKCNKLLKKHGITHAQFKVLIYLMNPGQRAETKQIDLEQHFQISNPTMTGILQRLEGNGFIRSKGTVHLLDITS